MEAFEQHAEASLEETLGVLPKQCREVAASATERGRVGGVGVRRGKGSRGGLQEAGCRKDRGSRGGLLKHARQRQPIRFASDAGAQRRPRRPYNARRALHDQGGARHGTVNLCCVDLNLGSELNAVTKLSDREGMYGRSSGTLIFVGGESFELP